MRPFLMLAVAVFISGLAVPAGAGGQLPYDVKNLPLDDASLQKLDDQHLRLTRRGTMICRHATSATGDSFISGAQSLQTPGCIMNALENMVREANDPALSAYHYLMPPSRRYNENRPTGYWRTVKQRGEAAKPG